jgi:metabolite-proton symporter
MTDSRDREEWRPAHLRRVVLASLIGTSVEWYDFFLYNYAAALVFNRLFFPKFDPTTGTILAFATYALGFVARPIGGVVFGHFGDKVGRKRLLIVSLILMGLSTTLIGFLPTYGRIGVAAPIALVCLRLIQGFAVGGQWGGAVLLAAEHAEPARRAFWASWPQAGVPAGNLLAVGVLAEMAAVQSDADFAAWGWRIPFILSVVLVGLGWWIRSSVAESRTFEDELKAEAPPKVPALDVFREQKKAVLVGAGLRLGENVSYYIITAYSVVYLTDVQHLTRSAALNATLAGAAIQLAAIPFLAHLADRFGRRPIYAFGGLGMAAFAFIFLPMLATADMATITLAIAVALILHGAMYGPQAAFIAELFPTRYRYSGVSIAYQLTSIVAGSLAPIIAIWLYKVWGTTVAVSAYVSACCLVSGITALLARETKGIDLAGIR